MAVVGSASIIVRAITTKVKSDIEKGFAGAGDAAEKAGRKISKSFTNSVNKNMDAGGVTTLSRELDKLFPRGKANLEMFAGLIRKGFALQGVFGAIAGSLSTLVGGLGVAVGALGQVAVAGVALANVFVSLGAGMMVARLATGGIGAAVQKAMQQQNGYSASVRGTTKSLQELAFEQEEAALKVDRAGINLENARETLLRVQDLPAGSRVRREAELAYQEAELAYRRALDARKDAGEAGDGAGGGANIDPFAGLTPTQKDFAKFLTAVQTKLQTLKEVAANAFLPELAVQIDRLQNAYFPTLVVGIQKIGTSMGIAVRNFTDIAVAGDNVRDFGKVMQNAAILIEPFGKIIGNIFDSLLSVLVSAQPLAERFVGFLEKKTSALADFLNAKQATGEMESFFNQAGDAAAIFGEALGNIFSSLNAIISATVSSGAATAFLEGFAKFTDQIARADTRELELFFERTSKNAGDLLSAFGGLFEIFIRLGARPEVGEFYRILQNSDAAMSEILNNSVEVMPAVADILATIIDIFAILSDPNPASTFLNTIDIILEGVLGLLKAIEPILDVVGPAFAALSAAVLALKGAQFFVSLLAGAFSLLAGALGVSAGAATAFGVALKVALGPIGWILTALSLVSLGLGAITENNNKAAQSNIRLGDSLAGIRGAFDVALLGNAQGNFDAIGELNTKLKDFGGYIKETIPLVDDLNKKEFLSQNDTARAQTLVDGFDELSVYLNEIATTDIPGLQRELGELYKKGLGTKDLAVLFDGASESTDKFEQTLIEAADRMDIDVYDSVTGLVDNVKLAEFAMGKGEIATRRFKEEMEALRQKNIETYTKLQNTSKSMRDQALEAVGLSDSLVKVGDSINGIKVTDLNKAIDATLENMKTDITEAAELNEKIAKLRLAGVDEDFINKIVLARGTDAIKAADQILNDPALLKKIKDTQEQLYSITANDAVKNVETTLKTSLKNKYESLLSILSESEKDKFIEFLSTETDPEVIKNTINANFSEAFKGLPAMTSYQTALSSLGDDVASSIIDPKKLSDQFKVANDKGDFKLNLKSAGADNIAANKISTYGAISGATMQVTGAVTAKQLNIDAVKTSGGLFGNKAYGGWISGPGGPRTDSIPTMLSNGEFVVNAISAAKYGPLLERINREGNRSPVDSFNGGITGFANGGSVDSSAMVSGGVTVNMVVNAAPGMDELEIASIVNRTLAFQLTKGGY